MIEKEPIILAVDTASSCSSVTLTAGSVQDGNLLATISLNSKVTHSRRLLTGIDWLLRESEISFSDIDGFAVGLGPGSFTGLRIGMATMKGLATAMDKPFLGVSTLDGLAFNCSGNLPLCALLDARKKEVYRRWYKKDNRGIYRPNGSIAALSPDAFASEITMECQLVGDGVKACGAALKGSVEELIEIAPLPLHFINATSIAFLCCEKLQNNEMLELESAVPLYVRASDAELSLLHKEN